MNVVALVGRLTNDPDVRYTESGLGVARYTLAVDRRYKKEGEQTADFISCVAFGKSAEFAEKYFTKGMRVSVQGRIQTGSYTNKEGRKIYTYDVVAENHEFAQNKDEGATVKRTDDGFVYVPDGIDEEVPFE